MGIFIHECHYTVSFTACVYEYKMTKEVFLHTRYVCIAGVNRMTSVATSLTLNLVLNLRKFTSLIFSILYFNNDFGFGAKMGSALVFFGTLIYSRAGMKKSPAPAATTPATTATASGNNEKEKH